MKYFTIAELCRSNVAQLRDIDNTPGTAQFSNMEKLVLNLLDPIREKWGKPIRVNSGFRCKELNKAIGGASNSDHLRGMAADITTGNKADNRRLFDLIASSGLPFRQLIDENQYSWVHVSYNEDDNKRQILHL